MSFFYSKYMRMKYAYIKLKKLEGGNNNNMNKKSKPYCEECVTTHSQNTPDGGYVWLNKYGFGKVVKVEFEEPVNSGNWRLYTDKWWTTHCKVVSHDPRDLASAHIRAFIDEKTRFAKMRFHFDSGNVVEATPEFYHLEQEYFEEKFLCNKKDKYVR